MQSTNSSVSQVLSDKVDIALSAYPAYPYQAVLGNGALKQLLLEYVECKLKETMPSLNEAAHWARLPQYLKQLVNLELKLESYIYWGIEYIVQNQLDLLLDSENPQQPSWNVQDMAQACIPVYGFG